MADVQTHIGNYEKHSIQEKYSTYMSGAAARTGNLKEIM